MVAGDTYSIPGALYTGGGCCMHVCIQMMMYAIKWYTHHPISNVWMFRFMCTAVEVLFQVLACLSLSLLFIWALLGVHQYHGNCWYVVATSWYCLYMGTSAQSTVQTSSWSYKDVQGKVRSYRVPLSLIVFTTSWYCWSCSLQYSLLGKLFAV